MANSQQIKRMVDFRSITLIDFQRAQIPSRIGIEPIALPDRVPRIFLGRFGFKKLNPDIPDQVRVELQKHPQVVYEGGIYRRAVDKPGTYIMEKDVSLPVLEAVHSDRVQDALAEVGRTVGQRVSPCSFLDRLGYFPVAADGFEVFRIGANYFNFNCEGILPDGNNPGREEISLQGYIDSKKVRPDLSLKLATLEYTGHPN